MKPQSVSSPSRTHLLFPPLLPIGAILPSPPSGMVNNCSPPSGKGSESPTSTPCGSKCVAPIKPPVPSVLTGDIVNTDGTGGLMGATHFDPQGVDVGDSDPFPEGGEQLFTMPEGGLGKIAPIGNSGGKSKCVLDGLETDCGFIRAEATAECPNDNCGPRPVTYQGKRTFA